MSQDYLITEHVHRFAAWAASRAAGTSRLCRFEVSVGKSILDATALPQMVAGPDGLPDAQNMDEAHRQWRGDVIAAANRHGVEFTHGVAAKLINVYLKAALVNAAFFDAPQVKALHPPIDSVLLRALLASGKGDTALWRRSQERRWSKFDSDHYEAVIHGIRQLLGESEPLWKIEEYWVGHQNQ